MLYNVLVTSLPHLVISTTVSYLLPPPQKQQGFFKMEAVDEYKPANEFQEDSKDPLLEVPLSDSIELRLIQWPGNKQDPDFDGQQLSIKLHHDGQFATFKASSGRISYEMVSYASQEPEATIFLSSASEAKIERQMLWQAR